VNDAPGRSAEKVKYVVVTDVEPIGVVVIVVWGNGPPGPTEKVSVAGVGSIAAVV
jgi:hypothetical protein